jgi:hypothetical protein
VIGVLRLGRYVKFVSRSVMSGFVNSLAILIFLAQTPQLIGANWQTFAMVAAGLAIIYLFPRLTKAVPSSLVAILALSAVAITLNLPVRTVGRHGPAADRPAGLPSARRAADLGHAADHRPGVADPGLRRPAGILLTANLLDDLTDTPSDKDRETRGQGIANLVSPLLGGMAGCALIGQSIINVKSGGRGRLSTFWAGPVPADPDPGAARLGGADPDGRPGGGDDHGVVHDLRLELGAEAALDAGAVDDRDAGHHPDRAGDSRPGQGRGSGRVAQRAVLRPQGGQDDRGQGAAGRRAGHRRYVVEGSCSSCPPNCSWRASNSTAIPSGSRST